MELENESSVPSSPSLSDTDEFYSAPSSPSISGSDVPRPPQLLLTRNIEVPSPSSPSPINPPGTLPLVEGNEFVWKNPHQIDLDKSPFSRLKNAIINDLKISFFFHVDEAFPFTTTQIWSPFCQARNIHMNNPAVGNMIYYDTDIESYPELPKSESVAHALFARMNNVVLNNVDMVYTAKNSSEPNPDFKYDQIKIVAPFYESKNIVLNNPVIQLITIIKDGGKRHCCPPENIYPPDIIYAPFFKARNLQINNANLLNTVETKALFSCPCLLSSIACKYFASAHNVSLESPSFNELVREPKERKKHTNLLKLLQCSLTGVELDSIHRWPYPRCHAGTRAYIRQKIITWLVDDNRKQDAFWLHGDAGNGKSAVAQTVGEYADQRGVLGAAAFISRSKKLNDSTRIITSLSLQLAHRNEGYERIVTKVIQENPSILDITTNKRTQFHKLVLEPFYLLEKESAGRKKTLIILDGLDEIDGKVAQSELIDLIAGTLHPSHNSPFLWLLCSRPELHLQDTFRQYKTQILYQSITTSLDADDAHKDIERYFLEELHRLKDEYSSCFASDANQLGETADFLSHIKSNPFLYASTLVRFIGGPSASNPAHQLEAIVDLVGRLPLISRSGNNYTSIDMLYLYILQTIPSSDELMVLRLLGVLTVSTPISALYLAAMFDIPKIVFYSILRPLYPVLLVPDEVSYATEALRFYHVSFPDFLTNPDYSTRFFQDPDLSRAQLAEVQLRAIAGPAILHSHTSQWYSHNSTLRTMPIYYDILLHAAKTTWDVCLQISHPSHRWLRDAFLNFNFQSLQDVSETISTYSFMRFLWWLRESVREMQDLRDIVRTSPTSKIDRDFVHACEQCHRYQRRKPIASPFPWPRDDMDQVLKEPRYALAGIGDKTVLILLTPETVMIFTARDINDL